jgi:sortase A
MSRLPSLLERVLVAIGCGCITVVGINLAGAASFQQAAGLALESQLTSPAPGGLPNSDPFPVLENGLIGRLEIPRLHMSVIVMEGDDDETLARAVGHMRGTAFPGESGNAVLAGHRDTFFRPLKNLREGDEIRMVTTRGAFSYRVSGTEIVGPNDVSVLDPTPTRSLTLVTCYPFTYVGPAPERFIIHAR